MMDRCPHVFEQSGHQCAYDAGHKPAEFHIATPTGESVEEYSTMAVAEAIECPYIDWAESAVSLDAPAAEVLEELCQWVRYVGEPPGHLQPATEVFISPRLNTALDERGLMLRLLDAFPGLVHVHITSELDDCWSGGDGILFSAKDPIDIRMAVVLAFPAPDKHRTGGSQ